MRNGEELKIYAQYFHELGLNVSCISQELSITNVAAEDKMKTPFHPWEHLKSQRQDLVELLSYKWDKSTGIGAVLGFDDLVAINIDGCISRKFIDFVLFKLGLPLDYKWVYKTGSGIGYCIVFKVSSTEWGNDNPIYSSDIDKKSYYANNEIVFLDNRFIDLQLNEWEFPIENERSSKDWRSIVGQIDYPIYCRRCNKDDLIVNYKIVGDEREFEEFMSLCDDLELKSTVKYFKFTDDNLLNNFLFEQINFIFKGHVVLPYSIHRTGGEYEYDGHSLPNEPFEQVYSHNFSTLIESVCLTEKTGRQNRKLEIRGSNIELISQLYSKKTYKNRYLLVDTETSGLPRSFDLKDENYPRILQIAWLILDEYGYIRKRQYHTIKIGDFKIEHKAVKLHGIDNDLANIIGDEMKIVLKQFISDLKTCEYLIAHNLDFDLQMINSELIRNNYEVDIPKHIKLHCTMEHNEVDGSKYLKLQELYNRYYDESYQPIHNALFDVYVLKKCFYLQNKDDYFMQPRFLDTPIKSICHWCDIVDISAEIIASVYSNMFELRDQHNSLINETEYRHFLICINEKVNGVDIVLTKSLLSGYKVIGLNKSDCEKIIHQLHRLIAQNLTDDKLSHCLFLLSIVMTIELQIELEIDEKLPPWEQYDYDSYQMIHEKRENIERLHDRCLKTNPNNSIFFAISIDDRKEIAPLYNWHRSRFDSSFGSTF